jgi:hypothetical protein
MAQGRRSRVDRAVSNAWSSPLEPAAVRARQRRAYQLEPLRRVPAGHPFGHALHAGFGEVRPSYGLVLVPLYERDGLRMGELARRAHTGKQTMTELVRRLERDGLVERRPDPSDARAVAAAVVVDLPDRAQSPGCADPRRAGSAGPTAARTTRGRGAQGHAHRAGRPRLKLPERCQPRAGRPRQERRLYAISLT